MTETATGPLTDAEKLAETYTFVPDIRPFDTETLAEIEHSLFGKTVEQHDALDRIRNENKQLFESASQITVVVEGRIGRTGQGWVGDSIEALRFIQPLLNAGKQVQIVTSEPSLIAGYEGSNVSVIPIPEQIPGTPLHPWNNAMLSFLGKQSDGNPVFFPMNAHMPVLVQLDAEGNVLNADTIRQIKVLTGEKNGQGDGIAVHWWAEHHIHQLQALQINADLIGFSEHIPGDYFPDPFIYPDDQSRRIADAVIGLYNCLPDKVLTDQSPVFLHPGVAVDSGKVRKKFYPEEKWRQVIDSLATNGSRRYIHPLIFLTPTDPAQAEMTKRLAEYAINKNIRTIQVPLIEVQKHFGWSLGSFADFLHRLSLQKGVIVGVDSMPAGHLGPALGMRSLVLGNKHFPVEFFSPPGNAVVILPKNGMTTEQIDPREVARNIKSILAAE